MVTTVKNNDELGQSREVLLDLLAHRVVLLYLPAQSKEMHFLSASSILLYPIEKQKEEIVGIGLSTYLRKIIKSLIDPFD